MGTTLGLRFEGHHGPDTQRPASYALTALASEPMLHQVPSPVHERGWWDMEPLS